MEWDRIGFLEWVKSRFTPECEDEWGEDLEHTIATVRGLQNGENENLLAQVKIRIQHLLPENA